MNKSEMRDIIDTRILNLVKKYYYDYYFGRTDCNDVYVSAIIEDLLLAFRFGLVGVCDYLRLVDICVLIGTDRTIEERVKHEY